MNLFNRKLFPLTLLTLMLAFSTTALAELPFTRPGNDAAMVSGTPGRPGADIYPVRFIEIDGRNIAPRDVFWLKPGIYEIKVQPQMRNVGGLQLMRGRTREEDGLNVIELVVEAGKSYYIGARSNHQNRRAPYAPILYRVEDNE